MGCASSKPSSSSSKNKKKDSSSNTTNGGKTTNANKSKTNVDRNNKSDANNKTKAASATTGGNELDELIKIDKKLLAQIDEHRDDVVNYIVNLVRRDLNAELVSNGNRGNIAALASAALSAPDNDSLITEASANAISLIKGGKCDTYRALAGSLKSSPFLCKNQTHKARICDLTADTIRRCLNDIYSHGSNKPDFNLLAYLQQQQQLTPPATPQKITDSQLKTAEPGSPNEFSDSILLSRAEANKVARILFLTDRARPVIHASSRKRGAYFVNIQQDDGTGSAEVPATRQQIEEIISFSAANRHQDQPSIYEVAETFLNNSEVALKLSPLAWRESSSSSSSPRNAPTVVVSPVQAPPLTDTPETPPVRAVSGGEGEVELVVEEEQVQASSTPNMPRVAAADLNDETIETDPAAGEADAEAEDADARIQLGAAANLILLANSLQNGVQEEAEELEALVPNDESIVVDEQPPSQPNTSNNNNNSNNSSDQMVDTEMASESSNVPATVEQNEVPSSESADAIEEQPPAAVKQDMSSSAVETGREEEDLGGDLKKVEAAATTIQATFRGYKTRKQLVGKTSETNSLVADNSSQNIAGLDLSDNDKERKTTTTMSSENTDRSNDAQEVAAEASSPTSDDLNNGDGELSQEQAVVKIQATYRGFRARKELKTATSEQANTQQEPVPVPVPEPPQTQPQAGTGGTAENTNTNQTNNK